MPTCNQCGTRWSWKQTFKKMWTLSNSMTCPYCEENQYQTKRSRTKCAFINLIILLPMLLNIFLHLSPVLLFGSFIILALVIFLLTPLLIELSNKEEFITFKH